jgi:hypothetical protein
VACVWLFLGARSIERTRPVGIRVLRINGHLCVIRARAFFNWEVKIYLNRQIRVRITYARTNYALMDIYA